MFADPVSDIAVLGEPDGQVLWNEARAYGRLMEAVTPIAIDGMAMGIVCTGSSQSITDGPNPRLTSHLPGWLLRDPIKPKGGK